MKKKSTFKRKPSWIRSKPFAGESLTEVKGNLKKMGLHTVCEEAHCPNLSECWNNKTATVMILGDICTRNCRFCNIATGDPEKKINQKEITSTNHLIDLMGLKYIVITSVTRDDLADQGTKHFANVVNKIKTEHPKVKIEVLIPDFQGLESHMHTLAKSGPFVIAHNIETVERLTPQVRDKRSSYRRSLEVLKFFKTSYPKIKTKSSLMVGLGETDDEILDSLDDLKKSKVDIVTVGQYLRPSKNHLEVEKYYTPFEFMKIQERAYQLGFEYAVAGPMVRSSYKASDYLKYLDSFK